MAEAQAFDLPTDIVALAESGDSKFIANADDFQELFTRLQEMAAELPTDMADAGARDARRSLAYKIARVKTAIDDTGKAETEDARAQIKRVDAVRKHIRDTLDEFKKGVREPLTKWEEAEKQREAEIETVRDFLRPIIMNGATSSAVEDIEALIQRVEDLVIDETVFREEWDRARGWRDDALTRLHADLAAAEQAERDKADLARLRAEEEKRLAEARRREAEEREAEARKVRAEQTIQHIEGCANGLIDGQPAAYGILLYELESKIVIDETFGDRRQEAEDARDAAIKSLKAKMEKEAAERRAEEAKRVQEEAERRAEAEKKAAAEAKKAAQLEAEKAVAKAREEERQRLEAARKAEEEAEAKRAANRRRRKEVREDILNAIHACADKTGCKIAVAEANVIVDALFAGEIPHTEVKF